MAETPAPGGSQEPAAAAGALYPLGLRVAGRLVVVVGGGPVAARRARGLADAGARVRVIAPAICEDLAALVDDGAGRAEWVRRAYRAGDLDGAWLAHTATGDVSADRQVADNAEALRIFCVTAGDAEAGTAWTPAVARVCLDGPGAGPEELTVSVHAGRDPRRAQAIRSEVQAQLESGALPVRRRRGSADRSPFERSVVRSADHSENDRPRGVAAGWVALVGGGPGDAGLITARGRKLLAQADVVVADRLGPRSLLAELAPDVQVVEVGKTAGNHPVPQDEINRILVQHAAAGRNVVRLKGGDPYVLGRGGEELAACREAGIEAEVVPGVTSAVSVPAAVGIPVTHRGVARGFSVLTGHDALRPARVDDGATASARAATGVGHDHGTELSVAVGGGPDHTLILLMGVSRLAETAAALTTTERPAGTPVAIVEDGYGPRERVTVGTLADIAERAAEAQVRPPAVVVVGDVVRLAPAWRDRTAG
ncbi:uroporphyrinogen-III C-methyltransferase [Myceligenerans pegani]|uniref:Uroporphyrinogen-III C-methyltransferase n=1 Tax=Myceligenerans pegani TaxID=2776917 RepID=A0ABR9MTZ9_9MICO|nr:uroporphyrinogen-III C-methyltransferase [Myceligenerans sp. TRM 65318]MBE1874373.1 uroporphyrinogen-III C-methyltransferase [Myceligenerans sp. TRM 65318]MBE3016644.1 uroporphyrinogen-III C-methyltransferase [Myceligenerans sp. TRM 65318]